MANNYSEILRNELTIDNAIDVIKKIEDTSISQDNFIKWKSYVNQVVIGSDNFFYKVYEETNLAVGPFYSIVRSKLAQIYNDLGIDWKFVSFKRGCSIFDFEQRQILKVATPRDFSFSRLIALFAPILEKLEVLLEFDSILIQLKKNSAFNSVDRLKLLRACVNKYDDYGIYNSTPILLDDADWFIAPVSKSGEIVHLPIELSIPVETSYGKFSFLNPSATNNLFSPNKVGETHDLLLPYIWCLSVQEPADAASFRSADSNDTLTISSNCSFGDRNFSPVSIANMASSIDKAESNIFDNVFDVSVLKELSVMPQNNQWTEDDLLYYNNMGRRSFQWELWQCCNNLCPFCYLGTDNRHTDKKRQLKSLADLKRALKTLDYTVYNNVSLIGGEFFQGQLADPEVSESFFDLIHMLGKLYKNKKLGSIWITATLTLGDQADLYKMLDIFEEEGVKPHPDYGASGVWICTSWDAEGRFRTEDRKKNWEYHMQNIGAYYPWVKKNTTIILTQKLCEMYLAGEYDPKKFTGQFNTFLFYKQPGLFQINPNSNIEEFDLNCDDDPDTVNAYLTKSKQKIEEYLGFRFYPYRRTFRQFLVKYAKQDPETFDRLFNIEYRADELHRNFNEVESEMAIVRDKTSNFESTASEESIVTPSCKMKRKCDKHIISYATYYDTNDCMICDRNQILEAVNKGRI